VGKYQRERGEFANMWNTIGGMVVSSFAEVFVKELVKEVKKAKPAPPQVRHTAPAPKATKNEPNESLTFSKGQVMIFEWVPVAKQETDDQDKNGNRQ